MVNVATSQLAVAVRMRRIFVSAGRSRHLNLWYDNPVYFEPITVCSNVDIVS